MDVNDIRDIVKLHDCLDFLCIGFLPLGSVLEKVKGSQASLDGDFWEFRHSNADRVRTVLCVDLEDDVGLRSKSRSHFREISVSIDQELLELLLDIEWKLKRGLLNLHFTKIK